MKQTRNAKTKVSIKKNYALSIMMNILSLIVPLITTPYISRTLGANGIGIYSYCLSIETYFVIIGTLGIPSYAKREIAANRNDREKTNKLYSELLTMQMFLLSLSMIVYVITTIIINTENTLMFTMCGIGIIAAAFDVTWLFQGIEDFSTVVKKSILFKTICVSLIFLLVKNESSLYLYAFALMSTNLICNVWLLIYAGRIAKYKLPKIKDIIKHLKPSFFLLLPSMVTAIYAVIDKTMLGALTGQMEEVGYYEQSQKIVTVSLALITAIGTVLMPRLSALKGQGNMDKFKKYINKGIGLLLFTSIPISIGCIIISNNLVPWFYGNGFNKIIILLKIFAPMYIFMGISDLIGTQMLISLKKEKSLLVVNVVSTLVNLSLNAILIPSLLSCGAAIATLVSEFLKCLLFSIIGEKYIMKQESIRYLVRYLSASIIMGITLYIIRSNLLTTGTITNTIILIILGSIIYISELSIIKDTHIKQSFNIVSKLIRKKGRA